MSDSSLGIEQLVRVPGVLEGSLGYDLAPDGRSVAVSWNISAPVQFIGGATDPRCPISQVYEAQAVMQQLGKPFELVIYPDEGHGFLKIDNHVDAERRWAEFLARYLGIE
jgi:dienelactone hydrolase